MGSRERLWDRCNSTIGRTLVRRPDVAATVLLVPVCLMLCHRWHCVPNMDAWTYARTSFCVITCGLLLTSPAWLAFLLHRTNSDRELQWRAGLKSFTKNAIILTVMSWVYSHVKVGVLLGDTYDSAFRSVDRLLLFGYEPWALSRQLCPLFVADFLAVIYMLFLPLLIALIFSLSVSGKRSVADELTCSLVLGYYIGALGYHLFPAYGPAFTVSSASAAGVSPWMFEIQRTLLTHVQAMQADPGSAVVSPWAYIGAFPSLHVGHIAIAAWHLRSDRSTVRALAVFGVLTALSTVHFGWHYMADWFGGLVVAACAVSITTCARSGFFSAAAVAVWRRVTAAPIYVSWRQARVR